MKEIPVFTISEGDLECSDRDFYKWLKENGLVEEALVEWGERLIDLFEFNDETYDCLWQTMKTLGYDPDAMED